MLKSNGAYLLYLGFDDTDTKTSSRGTGRCIRDFCNGLDACYSLRCVLRHQLPKLETIPFTSNNSSACAVIEAPGPECLDALFTAAADFLARETPDGSDPGVCLAAADAVDEELVSFALSCTGRQVTQQEAMRGAAGARLAGVGGTNDGIIGATAAVGLTRHGWSGRFIELGTMRSLPPVVRVGDLSALGIQVVSVDRDPLVPLAQDAIDTAGWLRPSLWAGQPVLQVRSDGQGRWVTALAKKAGKATAA